MARGLFSGILWGTLIGGAGLASLSLMYPGAPGKMNGSEIAGTETGIETGTETGTGTEAGAGSENMAPATSPPVAGTQAPRASDASGEENPAVMGTDAQGSGGTSLPSTLNPAPAGTTPPAGSDPVSQPETDISAGSLPGGGAVAGNEDVPALSGTDNPSGVFNPASGPATPGGEDVPQTGVQPAMPEVQTDGAQAGSPPEGMQGPQIGAGAQDSSPSVAAPGGATGAGAEDAPAAQTPPAAQDTGLASASGASVPGTPVGQIGDMAENVTTNRLPSIGQAQSGADAALPRSPAIERNAQSFENADGQPVMAILLEDIGDERSLLGDLKNLPFPVSFVVDVSAQDAAEAIAFYRNAGAEVVVSVPLPEGAEPSDIEVTLSAYAPLFEEAVAMMAPKSSGFQSLGPAATQVALVVAASGHGLISIPQGLNTGHKSALKQGVAAGLIFRELDNDGQTGAVIRRFLDNAAFKARQNDGVIMLGHARAETIQALMEWSLGNRAKSVALAPVSVILSGG
ncbi:MAG: hypothetical protein GY945_05620 [Rhodobacteraceae bacterium]|nr:hypothetical protein [Paracoccaceae bacterium]